MQQLIDATIKLRQSKDKRRPASVQTIREHLDSVYGILKVDGKERDKSYSGQPAHVLSTTVLLLRDAYHDYLLKTEILESEFFILFRDILIRAFNETRHEVVFEEEKRYFQPICDIVSKVADSITADLSKCKMISIFFDKSFLSLMTEELKVFASGNDPYHADQKVEAINILLGMFTNYYAVRSTKARAGCSVINLVNAALECVSSPVYYEIFYDLFQKKFKYERLTRKHDLFLDVCPTYIISYKRARHEPMFPEGKYLIMANASKVFSQFLLKKDDMQLYLFEHILLLIDVLLMIPASNFQSNPDFIADLISIVKLSETNWATIPEIKKIVQRTISLIYTLTTNGDLCEIIRQTLLANNQTDFFINLSLNSSNKHIKFTSFLISWTLNKQNQSSESYSPTMIRTFVHYLNKCGEDPSQQYYGVSVDSMVKTLTSLVENDDTQKELVRQDAVPTIMKCATDSQFDSSTVQQPSLECLWTMVFAPEVFNILNQSMEFLTHLRKLTNTAEGTGRPSSEDNVDTMSEQLKQTAEGLLWKLVEEPALLARRPTTTNYKYDIMMSYQRADEEICKKIYERLTEENRLRVWFDLKNLRGPIMTAMADAIDNSEIVLILVSEHYQNSRFTRAEAIYASNIKRPIIPIKLHHRFKPTSWLGMTLVDLYYVNFSTKVPFDKAYNELLDQIKMNKQSTISEKPIQDDQQDTASSAGKRPLGFLRTIHRMITNGRISPQTNETSQPSPTQLIANNPLLERDSAIDSRSTLDTAADQTSDLQWSSVSDDFNRKPMKNWTIQNVEDFLNQHRLEKFRQSLFEYDGEDLRQLYLMSEENNNELLKHLREEDSDIKLRDYIQLIKNIKKYIDQTNTNN